MFFIVYKDESVETKNTNSEHIEMKYFNNTRKIEFK